MKVSIVIPAHNEAQTITSAILAARAIEYPDFEIIVIDNASTDGTAAIARQFPVRVISEPDKGLLYARERGRREATGDIIANMDADCLPAKDWLARGVKWFERDRHISAVSGPYDYYDASPSFRFMASFAQKYLYSFLNAFLHFFRMGGIVIGGNTLLRASALEAIGGYDTSLTFWGEDTDTAKRISRTGTIVFDRNFIIKSSARRFHAQGTLRVAVLYVKYFLKVMFGARP